MSRAPRRNDSGSLATRQAPPKLQAVAKKFGILRRAFDAFMEFRQRDVDRQIACFLAARAGLKLTDDLEREIAQRVLTSDWRASGGPFNGRRFP